MRTHLSLVCLLLVSGCVSTPEFDKMTGVTPKTIIDTIECELIAARNKLEARRRRNPSLQSLCDYVAVAELSLQVDEQMALAPAFSHTDVVSKSLTRAFDWGLKFNTQAQRSFSQSVTFNIAKLKLDKAHRCDRPPGGVSLNGNLGIEEVIEMGFAAVDPTDVGVDRPGESDDAGKPIPAMGCPTGLDTSGPVYDYYGGRKKRSSGGEGKKENVFGTQIEFVLLRNMNSTGPTWTLQHFRGPGKLFSAERSDTHSVTIGFARAVKKGKVDPAGAAAAAKQQNMKSTLDSLKNNLRLQQRLP
jgi:hypothetical protein